MVYVFDTSALSALFKNFYPDIFTSLWELFDELVDDGNLISTREAGREIMDSSIDSLLDWHKDNKDIFHTPTAAEGLFVAEIYKVPHFQQNIEKRKLLNGGKNADPFIIAKASVIQGTVVTTEKFKPNATKIPNICKKFDVNCMSLEEFMAKEGWKF